MGSPHAAISGAHAAPLRLPGADDNTEWYVTCANLATHSDQRLSIAARQQAERDGGCTCRRLDPSGT
jgi:hypothetical protein